MTQLTLYFEKETAEKLRAAARKDRSSLSRLAGRLLEEATIPWPENLIKTFGALADSDFERPPQPRLEDDVPRESL